MKFSETSPPLSELAQRERDRQRAAIITAQIPFVEVNGRRALSRKTVEDNPELAALVRRFADCFEVDPHADVLLFLEVDQIRQWPAPPSEA